MTTTNTMPRPGDMVRHWKAGGEARVIRVDTVRNRIDISSRIFAGWIDCADPDLKRMTMHNDQLGTVWS